jgi:Domain of unknown function (DUF6438)
MRRRLVRSLLLAGLILDVTAACGLPKGPPVTQITLERTECKGTCPVYKVSFQPDGTVTYVGQKHVPRIGTFTGRIDRRTFGRMVELLASFNYSQLQDRYTSPITDHPHAITSVSWGDKRKTIDNYAEAGPTSLWAFELVLDAVTATVDGWKQVTARGKEEPGPGQITRTGMDRVRLGMPMSAVLASYGRQARRTTVRIEETRLPAVEVRDSEGRPLLTVMAQEGRVTVIQTRSPRLVARRGVRVGSRVRNLEAAYGQGVVATGDMGLSVNFPRVAPEIVFYLDQAAIRSSGRDTTWADVRRFNPRVTGILVEAQ